MTVIDKIRQTGCDSQPGASSGKMNSVTQTPSYAQFSASYFALLGWSDGVLPSQVIDTADIEGTTWLSRDIHFPSSFTATFIAVDKVAEQKDLGGIADCFYDNGTIKPHVDIPPPWDSSHHNFATTANLSREQQHQICMAHSAYIFGDSKSVASYHGMINQLHYPCHVAIFAGQQLIVRKGQPLITKAQFDGEPVVLFFDQLLMESGASINCLADTSIYVRQLLQFDGDIDNIVSSLGEAEPVVIESLGEDGPISMPGINGNSGAVGGSGSPAQDGVMTCALQAGMGNAGIPGSPGGSGGNGSRGIDAFYLTLKVGELNAQVWLGNYGGSGSDGSAGGNGGNGGDGGDGGAGSIFCPPGVPGFGGCGGNGGNGGSGGNIGDGRNIYISCWQYGAGSRFVVKPSRQVAGMAGLGGRGGEGGIPAGQPGKAGLPGKVGTCGRLGLVFENMQPIYSGN